MNKHLTKIVSLTKEMISLVKRLTKEFLQFYKEQSKTRQAAILAVGVIVFVVLGKVLFGGVASQEESKPSERKVTVSSVSALSNNEKEFPLVGTVTSVSEATLRAETSGKLVRVYRKLGDAVQAGSVIAEFDNSGERAALLQAEGAYEQAKAGRDIASLNSGQAGNSLGDTKTQALNAIANAYISMDDAIHGKTDQAYSDAKFEEVKLLLAVPDANLVSSLESKRKSIEHLLKAREAKNKQLTESSDLLTELTVVHGEVQIIKAYLDDLSTAYGKALADATFSQAALDAGKASTQGARQSISGVISALAGARTSLSASITASKVAGSGQSQISGSLASADAQVKQALGAYNAALSRLEKTIVRSPITGTLNSLSINTGDYVGAFTQVAVVSNNGALEVVSFVTEDDAKRITVGSPVSINGDTKGIVTRIAQALDPSTKKIEVRIGITSPKTSFINGQSVRVAVTKNKKELSVTRSGPVVIPLSALKLTPRGANVFTVTASDTLLAVPVKEGAILGEQIQILEGLTGDEEIVVDARGLKEGVHVTVDAE